MRITTERPGSAWRRLAWFVGLWAAGVVSVGVVAGVIRWLLQG